jgi:hypothetical protein
MGICQTMVNNCMGGVPQVCTPGTPGVETCNGIDDDCNGTPDDGLGTISCGMGICARTVPSCTGGVPQTCTPGVPGTETCNSMDDDCDGIPDNGLGSSTCGTGACLRTVPNCMGGTPQTCTPGTPGTETCNGMDEDCDGQSDNGFDVGAECTVGAGTCARQGHKICSQDGTTTVCDATPGAPGTETCDGEDEDCDGNIDNGFDVGTPCGVGGDTCVRVKVCTVDGTTTVCSGVGVPGAELCDGKDNDCDGMVDNGFDVGMACTSGVGACAAAGTRICAPGGRSTLCNGVPGMSMPEVCDQHDNDCDGATDEGFGTGTNCTVGVGECARTGVRLCTADGAGTFCNVTPGAPGVEICGNGKDEDCDGTPDEGCAPPPPDAGLPDAGPDASTDGPALTADAPAAADAPVDAGVDTRAADAATDRGAAASDAAASDAVAIADAARGDAPPSSDAAARSDAGGGDGGPEADGGGAGGAGGQDADTVPPGILLVKGGGCECSVSARRDGGRPSALILLGVSAVGLFERIRRRRRHARPRAR